MEKKAKRRIHVSNIPYELTRDDLIDLFGTVGPVLDCELIMDKQTGKFKGSAKIEYPDYFTAKAALRNLNRFEIKGRFLKINFANVDKSAPDLGSIINEDDFSDPEDFEAKNAEKDLEEVVQTLQTNQKFFLLLELKQVCDSNEEEFKNLLKQDEKTAQLILNLQRELKMDRPKQMYNRNYYEEDQMMSQQNYNMMNSNPNRNMNRMYVQNRPMMDNIGGGNMQQRNQMQMMNKPRQQQQQQPTMMQQQQPQRMNMNINQSKTGYNYNQPQNMGMPNQGGYRGYNDPNAFNNPNMYNMMPNEAQQYQPMNEYDQQKQQQQQQRYGGQGGMAPYGTSGGNNMMYFNPNNRMY